MRQSASVERRCGALAYGSSTTDSRTAVVLDEKPIQDLETYLGRNGPPRADLRRVMADDVGAGIYALIGLMTLRYIFRG